MKKAKLISFDLDNTLINPDYITFVWEIAVPRLYAKKYGVSFSEAVKVVISEYEGVGDGALEWYDIKYWFDYFDLSEKWEDILERYKDKIKTFPEVKGVIEDLVRHYDLIVTSNAAREFIEIEIKKTGIEDYFKRIFSATSDFGQVKKTPEFYNQVCEIMETDPKDTIHVGDHYEFDYLIPKKLGIKAYYLNRDGDRHRGQFVVKDLKEFAHVVKEDEKLVS